MKKYNILIFLSLLLYLLLASGLWIFTYHIEEKRDNMQYVEANRIVSNIKMQKDVQDINTKDYTTVKTITFLPTEQSNQAQMEQFFDESEKDTMIRPLYQEGILKGYVKIIFFQDDSKMLWILKLSQMALAVMELMVVWLLFYIRKNIIKPFQQLEELPLQMIDGHYKKEVYVEKSKYFQRYIHGMAMLKEEMNQSSKRQLELLKEKKQLLLSLSHDIKTPLNMIKLYGKALREDLFENEQSRNNAWNQIDVKCDEIENYVNTIMKSSREDIIDFKVEITEFYLADLIKAIQEVYIPRCEQRAIHFEIEKVRNRLIKGDFHRAQEVLENILENAIKYGDGRTIRISLYEEDFCQLISIYNSGEAVHDQEMNHLFDSFYRGSNAKGKQGNGLGLAICQNLMQKMDGAIYAEKNTDGMTFTVVFR